MSGKYFKVLTLASFQNKQCHCNITRTGNHKISICASYNSQRLLAQF